MGEDSVKNKLRKVIKPAVIIYPLIVIVAIPVLLVINTAWNLRSFNRDANFIIRHNAVSIADIVKPNISERITTGENLNGYLSELVTNSDDLISASLLSENNSQFTLIASSTPNSTIDEVSQDALNKFALSLNEAFAGLSYDPNLAKNVWVVAVPLEKVSDDTRYVLSLKMTTESVEEILSRTTKDSLIILIVTIIITLALLANHFIFYKKALRAEQLAELDRLKDEFISLASHELRAPVTGLVGYLDLIKDKIPKNLLPTIQPDLNILKILTRDLNNLINDLLEVSRIEQGRLKVTMSEVNVNLVINEVITKMKPTAEQKCLKFTTSLVEIPQITTDPERLTQILNNLISNAIKYTLKGSIEVISKIENNFVQITVKDTGVGIPAEEVSKLFGKFHRVRDEKTKEAIGTGLGLWITKQLVEILGGKIFVESIYGTGSSFTFTLPLKTSNIPKSKK